MTHATAKSSRAVKVFEAPGRGDAFIVFCVVLSLALLVAGVYAAHRGDAASAAVTEVVLPF